METQRGGEHIVSGLFTSVVAHGRLSDEHRAQIRDEILTHFRGPRAADCQTFITSDTTRRIVQRLWENGENPSESTVGAAIEHIWHGGRLPRGLRVTLLMWLLGELGPSGRRAWSDRRVAVIQNRGGPYREEGLHHLGTEMRPVFVPFLDHEDVIQMAGDPRLVGTGSNDDVNAERPTLGPELGLAFRIARASVRLFDWENLDESLEDWQPDVVESMESLTLYFGDISVPTRHSKREYRQWKRIQRIIRQGIHGASNLRSMTIEAFDATILEEITLAMADAPFVLSEFEIQGSCTHRSGLDQARATLETLARSPALRGLRRLTVVPYGSYLQSGILPDIFVTECGQSLEVLRIEMWNSDRTSVSRWRTNERDRCSKTHGQSN